jgi:GNAT superfamily N-acetyltransferase
MQAEVRALIDDPLAGTLLVADAEGSPVPAVLAASWQIAIHVPGRYALIQDLWVPPSLRGEGIGAALVDAFAGIAREQGVARIEVGLPKPSFIGIAATEAFYVRNGFDVHGARMRMLLA